MAPASVIPSLRTSSGSHIKVKGEAITMGCEAPFNLPHLLHLSTLYPTTLPSADSTPATLTSLMFFWPWTFPPQGPCTCCILIQESSTPGSPWLVLFLQPSLPWLQYWRLHDILQHFLSLFYALFISISLLPSNMPHTLLIYIIFCLYPLPPHINT